MCNSIKVFLVIAFACTLILIAGTSDGSLHDWGIAVVSGSAFFSFAMAMVLWEAKP